MRVVSWNINGLQARIKAGFMDFFESAKPDILCMQELKLNKNSKINGIRFNDYVYQYWNICNFVPAYSGTAILSKIKPLNVQYGIGDDRLDSEARSIIADFDTFFLITVYMPNTEHKLTRMDMRLKWDDLFYEKIHELSLDKPIIICGDMNCTLGDEDVRHTLPKTISQKFIDETRFNLLTLMNQNNLVDAFKFIHPDANKAYTWWSYRRNKIKDNVGWRLDYFLVSHEIMNKVTDCGMYPNVYGSDHCPIYLEYQI